MKRFLIKSIACLSLAILLAGVLPSSTRAVDTSPVPSYGGAPTTQAQVANYSTQAAPSNSWWGKFTTNVGCAFMDCTGAANTAKANPVQAPTWLTDKLKNAQSQAEAGAILNGAGLTDQQKADLAAYKGKLGIQQNVTQQTIAASKDPDGCEIWDLGCKMSNWFSKTAVPAMMGLLVKILNYLLYAIVSVLALLLGAVGNMLDGIMGFTLQISTYVGPSTKLGQSIIEMWTYARDIFNIFFIFILLYVAITTILGITKVETKKMLMNVIISALFINFSLFVTNIIIDTSNVFAAAFYSHISAQNAEGDTQISEKIMTGLGLQATFNVYNTNNANNSQKSVGASQNTVKGLTADSLGLTMLLVVQIIMFSLTIWALVQAVVLLATRTILFFVLMALAPVGFVSNVMPRVKEYSTLWWDTLNSQALVAPVFLFFMVLLSRLIDAKPVESFDLASSNTTASGFMIFLNLIIIVGFIIVAVKITKKIAGGMGAKATAFAAGGAGLALGSAFGLTALAGRNVIGGSMASAMLSGKGWRGKIGDKIKDAAPNSRIAQSMLNTLKSTSKRSFDVRSTPVAGWAKKIGIDMGQGPAVQKGGFDKTISDKAKKEEEMRLMLAFDERGGKRALVNHDNKVMNVKERLAHLNAIGPLSTTQRAEKEGLEKELRELNTKGEDRKKIEEEGKNARANAYLDKIAASAWTRSRREAATRVRRGKTTDEQLAILAAKKQKELEETAGKTEEEKTEEEKTGAKTPKTTPPSTNPPAGGTTTPAPNTP